MFMRRWCYSISAAGSSRSLCESSGPWAHLCAQGALRALPAIAEPAPSPRQRSQGAPRAAGPGRRRRRREVRGAIFKSLGPRQLRLAGLGAGVPPCEGEPGRAEDRAVRGEPGCERGRTVVGVGWVVRGPCACCPAWRTGGEAPWPLPGPSALCPGPGRCSPRGRDRRARRSSVPAAPPPGAACCGLCGLLRSASPGTVQGQEQLARCSLSSVYACLLCFSPAAFSHVRCEENYYFSVLPHMCQPC